MQNLSYKEVQNEWTRIQKLDPKSKYKELKKLCYSLQVTQPMSLEQIDFYDKLINKVKKVIDSATVLNKKSQQFYLEKLKLLNIDIKALETIFKKKFNIRLYGAMFSIGDQKYTSIDYILEEYQERIRKGQRITVSTGSDGLCAVNLRVINLDFPVFTKHENAAFIDNSPVYILDVPSGCISISEIDPEITFKVPAGYYRMTINLHENPRTENYSYYICLAPMK